MTKRKASLLTKAQGVVLNKKRATGTAEEIELALAWLCDEVSVMQIHRVMNPSRPASTSGNVLYRIAVSLRTAYDNGQLKIVGR